jgi:demethylmenaquinone methyltransferase/2-methoxy-6-polyprenyl-1,4-benzoquinol methylase
MFEAWKEAHRLRAFREDIAALRELCRPATAVKLLDVGSGSGVVTEALARGCGEIVALEPDERRIALGRSRRPALTFVQGYAESMTFETGSFDRVTAVGALHHMHDQPRALAEMRRVLREGGRLVLMDFYPDSGMGRFLRVVGGSLHRRGLRSPEQVVEAIRSAGFRDVVLRRGRRGFYVSAVK